MAKKIGKPTKYPDGTTVVFIIGEQAFWMKARGGGVYVYGVGIPDPTPARKSKPKKVTQ